ncbi:MAG: nucleoside hydrolase [Pseudonocardiaceae bacterium]
MTVPVIIDTDPGVDDAVALMLAATSPEVELLAVTTVFGNVDLGRTTSNALRLRTLAGLGRLPVAAGAARPLVHPHHQRTGSWHSPDGLGGRADLLPAPDGAPHPLGAVSLMAGLLRSAAVPVTLVAIGPLTNIALLLAVHPEMTSRIGRIVIMGGHLDEGASSEFNISSDPEAAHRVLTEEGLPTTLVPLDLTLRATIDADWIGELAAAGPRCAALAGIIERYRVGVLAASGRDAVALHDALAVLEAAVPGALAASPMALEVVCDHGPARGALRAAAGGGNRCVQVARDADLTSINATILNRLRHLR